MDAIKIKMLLQTRILKRKKLKKEWQVRYTELIQNYFYEVDMCGCNRNKNARMTRTTASVRSVQGGLAAALTPTQLRAQRMSGVNNLNSGSIDAERRKVQEIRRNAIRNKFNK